MKTYYVYAERDSYYGRTEIGYFVNKSVAKKALEDFHEKAKKDKSNSAGFKVDGYFKDDLHIEEIEVKGENGREGKKIRI